MRVLRCGIHGFDETLGIDVEEFRFYWTLETQIEDDKQSAYRIIVSTQLQNELTASPPTSIVWDSAKVCSSAQRNVIFKPAARLRATTNYFWQVIVWDAAGQQSCSQVNHFFTAYPRSTLLPPWSMNQTYMPHTSLIFRAWFENEHDRWKATWVGNGGDKPIYLRKSFRLEHKPQRAIALASGVGHFNLTCNGLPASNHVLDPGWTNYHRTVQFVGYDLTDHLHVGDNALGAHVGNGWYAGDQGDRFFFLTFEDNTYVRYGNELCFFAELHLFYEGGKHEVIVSDPTWKVRVSATTLANIYMSETQDRRLYPVLWDTGSFDDSGWSEAKPVTGPRGQLKYQSQPPVVLHETFEPVSCKTVCPGTVSFDLGQNMSNMVKISVKGKAGSEIIVRYSETVRDDGRVLMPDRLYEEFDRLVYSKIYLAGTGEPETWQMEFSFTSARYIQIDGASLEEGNAEDLPVVLLAVGQHVSTAARRLGSMKTDKADVNQLINACYWSFVSNLFSYKTDCPQFEKFGWQEVVHHLSPATQYIRDMESLYTKILDDVIDTQEPSGLCPTMAPLIRYMWGPLHDTITWGCSVCFLPWILKKYYGSTHVIPRVYPAAKRYMEYIRKKERQGGLIAYGLGDWGRDIAYGNHQANIETAMYYHSLRCCEMMATELGQRSEADEWRTRAERVWRVYNEHLLVTTDPSRPYAYYTSLDDYPTRDCTAVAQAVALQMGMVPAKHIPDVQRAFLDDVQDNRIRAGEIGLKYLWNTLSDLDRPDTVLAMARQEEHPSYMRFVRRGETTLNEFWQDDCRSKCHDMLGTIYEWFYVSVLGVKLLDDAYRRFEIRPPYASEFDFVEGSVDCPYGLIRVKFERAANGNISLNVTVPVGTVAELILPKHKTAIQATRIGGRARTIASGGESLELRHGTYQVSMGDHADR